jgi:hypothetical protein
MVPMLNAELKVQECDARMLNKITKAGNKKMKIENEEI